MKDYILSKLKSDVRFQEGLSSCMNCGICTAICPAAEFYQYDPRVICNKVQSGNVEDIISLLEGEEIWYCGQCMSCKTRCPRGNAVGLLITSLRLLSQELGYFTKSEKGRQQLAIKRAVGESIIQNGYCVHPDIVTYENHPEQGPVWKWFFDNIEEVSGRVGARYKQEGAGALRKIAPENLAEIRAIFEVTGGEAFYQQIENSSKEEAARQGIDSGDDYFNRVYTDNNESHTRDI